MTRRRRRQGRLLTAQQTARLRARDRKWKRILHDRLGAAGWKHANVWAPPNLLDDVARRARAWGTTAQSVLLGALETGLMTLHVDRVLALSRAWRSFQPARPSTEVLRRRMARARQLRWPTAASPPPPDPGPPGAA